MARERKQCRGVFQGLFVGENVRGGIIPAVEGGQCRVVPYIKNSKVPELLQLEEEVVNTFIRVDRLGRERGGLGFEEVSHAMKGDI